MKGQVKGRLCRIEFEDKRRLIVLAAGSGRELTSQSGKLNQSEVAKKVLNEENQDAGIFVIMMTRGISGLI